MKAIDRIELTTESVLCRSMLRVSSLLEGLHDKH